MTMRIELLVDAKEFWARLKADLQKARKRAFIQALTFEGDRAGSGLGRALERSPAKDRRLLVDGFSLLYHSDRCIPGPAWLDPAIRREVLLTRRWVDRLKRGGASVRFCNPLGPSPIKLIRRNHKKIAVVDDRIVYLGGINFSDHNFAWHDMMLRVEDRDLASLIARDFGATWEGKSRSTDCSVGPLRLISLNGRSNAKRVGPILDSISSAQRSIDVVSAYLSHPFTHHLAEARRRGVRIRVLTPGKNNYPNLARHILQTAYEHDFEVYRYQGMSHLKAMLIDEELLITGSCNFDLMSYHLQEELIVMTRDRSLGNGFVERVWAPDFAVADRTLGRPTLGTLWGNGIVRLTAGLVGLMALT